jgi:hypothetical protein
VLASATPTPTSASTASKTATQTALPSTPAPTSIAIQVRQAFSMAQAQIGQQVTLDIFIENGAQALPAPFELNLYLPAKLLLESNALPKAQLIEANDHYELRIENLQANEKRVYQIPLRVAQASQFGDLLETKVSSDVNGSEKFIELAKLLIVPGDLPSTGYPYQITIIGQTLVFLALLLIALGGIAVLLGLASRLIRASGGKNSFITGSMIVFGILATAVVLLLGLSWGINRNQTPNANPVPTSTIRPSGDKTPSPSESIPAPTQATPNHTTPISVTPATPAGSATPVPTQAGPATPDNSITLPSDVRLIIPNLGIDREIITVKFGEDGWDVDMIDDEVGLLAGTGNQPEAVLAMVLTGHATLKDGFTEGDFAKLNRLQPTDEIILRWGGVDYIYLPTVQDIVQPDTIDRIILKDGSLLLLVTCIERDLLSGEFSSRQVTEAKLVRKVPVSSNTP